MNSKNTVCTRQICFIFLFMLPVSKLLSLPSVLAKDAGGDLIFPLFFHTVFQAVGLLFVFLTARKTDMSLYEIFEKKCGKAVAKTVYALLGAFLIASSLLPLMQLERFVYSAFFDSSPFLSAFLPFFVFSTYVSSKNIRAFGRIADICMPLFIIAYLGILIMSVGKADFSNLLPLFGTPLKQDAVAFSHTLSYFSDSAIILALLGNYRYEKGDMKKLLPSYLIGQGLVAVFFAVFYGVYGALAPHEVYAFHKIAQYFSALSVVGRVDLLLVYLFTVVLLFFSALPILLATVSVQRVFGVPKQYFVAVPLNIALALFVTFSNKHYASIFVFFLKKSVYFYPVFVYLLPVICLLFSRNKKEKTYAK